MNRNNVFGTSDWRLPNRRELRSLMSHQTRQPALPDGHPFVNVFSGWYWTSTTAAINTGYAWYIHMEGARMFYGQKEQYFLLWPVRGRVDTCLHATGQTLCYDAKGHRISCAESGQDGEFRSGVRWPEPRFEEAGSMVVDRLTNLCWQSSADLTGRPSTWEEALKAVADLNQKRGGTCSWRLPNINELESLVDCKRAQPGAAPRPPLQGCQGRILVFHDKHVRTRLGLGALSHQRGGRCGTQKHRAFLSLGGMRSPLRG